MDAHEDSPVNGSPRLTPQMLPPRDDVHDEVHEASSSDSTFPPALVKWGATLVQALVVTGLLSGLGLAFDVRDRLARIEERLSAVERALETR